MPLDNYTCLTLQNCFVEIFSILDVNNPRRLVVIGTHINCNVKLKIIVNRRLELTFNQGYDIVLRTSNPE